MKRTQWIAGLAACAAAVSGLTLGLTSTAHASAQRPESAHLAAQRPESKTPKPTIVLVHGAWGDSSSWDGVVSRLQHDGYTVDVPPNPLQGLTYDAGFIRDYLHTISGPIVLVGHSYGGAVITNAATGDKQVKALVYVDAFAPAQGQSIGQLTAAKPGSCVLVPANTIAQIYPGAPKGAGYVYIKQSVFGSCMANGLPAAAAAQLAAVQRPLTSVAFTQKSGVPAWKTIPSWAVVGTADHAIPPAELLAMAHQAHAHVKPGKDCRGRVPTATDRCTLCPYMNPVHGDRQASRRPLTACSGKSVLRLPVTPGSRILLRPGTCPGRGGQPLSRSDDAGDDAAAFPWSRGT